MHDLVAELGLSSFAQHEQGDMLIERGLGYVLRRQGYHSANPSMRIGGTIRLIDTLVANLPTDCIHLNTQVLAATLDETGIALRLSAGYCEPHSYSHLWLAIPPRLASRIAFAP